MSEYCTYLHISKNNCNNNIMFIPMELVGSINLLGKLVLDQFDSWLCSKVG